ncbi:MAG: hypothetical protein GXO74_07780 [Calditrichaeota bacterium]|nr:hypothetical protein [Calditrichota bacterium]
MNKKTSLNALLIEIFSIIIAVILGFVANEWRENFNNKAKAQSALHKIAAEIEQNRAQLQNKQKYYKKMISVLDSLTVTQQHEEAKIEAIPGWQGFNPPLLSSSSYKTATTIGVFSFIDFDTADQISKVYQVQEVLQGIGIMTINSLIAGQIKDYDSVKLIFAIQLEIIKGLLTTSDRVLSDKLKKYRE